MAVLLRIADFCDAVNGRLGRLLSYLVLVLVLVQFALVVMSAAFQIGSIKLQESLLYLNALMFLGAAGYTLLKDGHVRIDIFYRGASPRAKAAINLFGALVFLFPFLGFVWWIGVPYAVTSWANLEASFETSGLQIVFILKSFVLLFALTLTLQGLSNVIRNFAILKRKSR